MVSSPSRIAVIRKRVEQYGTEARAQAGETRDAGGLEVAIRTDRLIHLAALEERASRVLQGNKDLLAKAEHIETLMRELMAETELQAVRLAALGAELRNMAEIKIAGNCSRAATA